MPPSDIKTSIPASISSYGQQRELEYDFVLQPGARPDRIALGFQGADKLELAGDDLLLHTSAGVIRQQKPVIYQEIDGIRREIAGGYVLRGPRRVGFRLGTYDTSRALVIDPALIYSTYLGGSGDDFANAIAVDDSGNTYVTGQTQSPDFPQAGGAVRRAGGVFVTKLNRTGSALVYSTFLGDSFDEGGTGIAVDSAGNAYVVGFTSSMTFPTTPGSFRAYAGG